MKESIHQRQDENYRHTNPDEEARVRCDNDVVNASKTDITNTERITEVEEAARSEEGLYARENNPTRQDVGEDREDNTEPPPLDVPPSAIIR